MQAATGQLRIATRLLTLTLTLTFMLTLMLIGGWPSPASARDAAPGFKFTPEHLREDEVSVDQLPVQARHTLQLIRQGGPYPYRKDGTVFGNRERLLPRKPRGYYTEYTVPTPYARDRGARRIIAGGEPGRISEFYYTEDHYGSFRKIRDPIR